MILKDQSKIQQVKKAVVAVSIVIPIAVAALFKIKIDGFDTSFLPSIYATINAMTALILVFALVAIKRKNMTLHRRYIRIALLLSIVFLLCYVVYHITSDPTTYAGDYRGLYLSLLISHVGLSVIIIPLVLFTYLFAWTGQFEKHRKWAKITWPLWFYVAVSGVLVYWMISPFYGA